MTAGAANDPPDRGDPGSRNSGPRRFAVLILAAAALVPLLFVLRTHLIWEDFFITYRYSENLARGRGLVFTPGEPVYGFTSPLNTLIPALAAFVFRAKDYAVPLWIYRGVSYLCLLLGIIAATRLLLSEARNSRARYLAGALFPLLAVLEIKTTTFAMSGQEAGLMIGIFAPMLALMYAGWSRHPLLGGLLGAALMYTRPDGCIYILAVAAVAFAFERGPRRPLLAALAKSAVICGLIYLPWFLFTWHYYGSPIPHTVIAKHGVKAFHSSYVSAMAPLYGIFAFAPSTLCLVLGPVYDPLVAAATSWPKWMHDFIVPLQLIALLFWLVPTGQRMSRMLSGVTFLLFCYLSWVFSISAFAPWYFPPLAFATLLTLVSIIGGLAGLLGNPVAAFGIAGPLLAGLLALLSYIFFLSLPPLKIKQEVIEWDQRREIGLWLKDHVSATESVYLEPLGYIGYFSQRRILDWPGLVSPEVVAARRKIGHEGEFTWAEVAEELKPDWIVARLSEAKLMQGQPFLSHHYDTVTAFDMRDKLRAAGEMRGISMLYPDEAYIIYRRRD